MCFSSKYIPCWKDLFVKIAKKFFLPIPFLYKPPFTYRYPNKGNAIPLFFSLASPFIFSDPNIVLMNQSLYFNSITAFLPPASLPSTATPNLVEEEFLMVVERGIKTIMWRCQCGGGIKASEFVQIIVLIRFEIEF